MTDFPSTSDVRFGGLDQLVQLGNQYAISAPAGTNIVDPFVVNGYAALTREDPPVVPSTNYATEEVSASLGDTWYEIIHVFPFSFDFGNILSNITQSIEIYNADRFASHTFQVFTNNAGAGITIDDLPALPTVLPSQSGLTLTLTVSSNGPPVIDGTLDFQFDLYTSMITLTGRRIVMFPFEPESPIQEQLEFLTDIFTHKDETEQRVSLRKNPRQVFGFPVFREEGPELARFDTLMFEWQSRVFGLPIWTESTYLTASATAGDTVISVDSTAFADFRVGSLLIILDTETSFEALGISAVGSNTITLDTPLTTDFNAETLVMPIRTALVGSDINGIRYPVNAAVRNVEMRVLDNDVGDSFADASAFTVSDPSSVIDGEILLDGPNLIQQTLQESLNRRVIAFDGDVGIFSQDSTSDYNRRGSSHTFLVKSRETLWQVRRLLHYLRGRQVSFFVPSNFKDLLVTQPLLSGTNSIIIRHIGFTQFAQFRNRYRLARFELTDGTKFDAEITASSEISSTEEQLTLSRAFTQDLEPSDFRRVDFYERVRIDSDKITIRHIDSGGQAIIGFPIRSTIS